MTDVYESRLDVLRKKMDDACLDVAMITSPVNIYYLTGFYSDPHERFMALVIDKRSDRRSLFVPSLDVNAAEETAHVRPIIAVSDSEDPYEKLRREIGSDVNAFGVEKQNVSLAQYENLANQFPVAAFIDVEAWIMAGRLKKTPADIAHVRRAVHVIEEVLHRGIDKFVPGVTELELTAELEYQMKVLGADRPAFSTTVLSGKRSALPHGSPGKRKIEHGDFLLIDTGVFVDGFCSDITRTFIIGEGTENQVRIYEAVLEANRRAINAVKTGVPIGDIDRAARDHIEACGYGQYFNHRVGHGLGLEIHEAPSIHEENDLIIEPGLLFTIEPGIYIPEFGGVRIEDDVYVGADGQVEVLTSFPKELRIL